MPFGAGLVAARNAGAGTIVDPRPYAVGSIKRTLEPWPQLTNVLPAMEYDDEQLKELEATINDAERDVIVTGTTINLGRLITSKHRFDTCATSSRARNATLIDVLEPLRISSREDPVALGCLSPLPIACSERRKEAPCTSGWTFSTGCGWAQ
jgi:predicted GTPase